MDTTTAFGLMDVIVLGGGIYLLYGWYLLVFKNEMKPGVLVSKDVNPKKCKDLEGYKRMLGPKTLALALAAMLSGGLGLFQTYVRPVPGPLYWIVYFAFFGILVWFTVTSKKAQKLYF